MRGKNQEARRRVGSSAVHHKQTSHVSKIWKVFKVNKCTIMKHFLSYVFITALLIGLNACKREKDEDINVLISETNRITAYLSDNAVFDVDVISNINRGKGGLVITNQQYRYTNLRQKTTNFLRFRLLVIDTTSGRFDIVQNREFSFLNPNVDSIFYSFNTQSFNTGFPYLNQVDIIDINTGPGSPNFQGKGFFEGQYQLLAADTSSVNEQGVINGVVAPDGKFSFLTNSSNRFRFLKGSFGVNNYAEGVLLNATQANYALLSAAFDSTQIITKDSIKVQYPITILEAPVSQGFLTLKARKK